MDDIAAGQATEWAIRGSAAAAALAETWGSMAEVCHALAGAEWELPTECPGWTVRDQISHLIGIERMVMGEGPPEFDGPLGDHVKNDFASLNEKWIAVRRTEPGDRVLAEFVAVTGERLASLAALSDDGWATVGPSPVGEVAYARFMETRVFDSWVHEQDVRLALDRPGGSGGLASAAGLGEMQSAMGFVVGKKARAPEGTVVRFELSGPPGDARQFALRVDGGRAVPLEGGAVSEVEATVTLRLSSIDFLRLACGRATPAQVQAAAGSGVEGDPALGGQILDSMNFMF